MKKTVIALVVVLVLGLGIGWLVWGRDSDSGNQAAAVQEAEPGDSQTQGIGNEADESPLKSLVSYSLPEGWQEASCDDDKTTVYVLPQDIALNCSTDPAAPISISIDPQGTSDCSQLDGQQGVRQHVCKSLDINGDKSLEASTTSADGKTVASYYVRTGQGVIKAEYHYEGQPAYKTEFERIAKSITEK